MYYTVMGSIDGDSGWSDLVTWGLPCIAEVFYDILACSQMESFILQIAEEALNML